MKCAPADGWVAVTLNDLVQRQADGWDWDYRGDVPVLIAPTGERFHFAYVKGRGACLRPVNFKKAAPEVLAGEAMPEPPED